MPDYSVSKGWFHKVGIGYRDYQIYVGNTYFAKLHVDIDGEGSKFEVVAVSHDVPQISLLFWEIKVEAEFLLEIFEDAVLSNNGTPVNVFNHNRNFSEAITSTVFHTPSITDEGDNVYSAIMGSAKKEGGIDSHKFVGKRNSKYLFRFTKADTGAHWVDFFLSFIAYDWWGIGE
jgi:hypothetical protein